LFKDKAKDIKELFKDRTEAEIFDNIMNKPEIVDILVFPVGK
jgi:hypothetical protein